MTFKFSSLCPVACHAAQPGFVVPPPGAPRGLFIHLTAKTDSGAKRQFFAILPKNHDADDAGYSPRVALIGLSPAENQIKAFEREYRKTRNYDAAARKASFAGLAKKIIEMLEATGGARALGLTFVRTDTFDRHPDIYTDSLVRCATLDANPEADEKSKDWRPADYEAAIACVTARFLPSVLNPQFTRLKTIIVFGAKGWAAINDKKLAGGVSVHDQLVAAGKRVIQFPHPAGGNNEYVALAKCEPLPEREPWLEGKWQAYREEQFRAGDKVQDEDTYKGKRRTMYAQIEDLRAAFSR